MDWRIKAPFHDVPVDDNRTGQLPVPPSLLDWSRVDDDRPGFDLEGQVLWQHPIQLTADSGQ